MKVKKTNVEKVVNMFATGKKFKSDSIAKRLFGQVNEKNKSNVRAIISKLNRNGANIVRVDMGTYQQQ